MYLHDLTPVIQSSVTPVLMISGVGLILLSMTNRYGRVIDNARRMMKDACSHEGEEKAIALHEVRIMYGRCHSLKQAIFLASLSLLTMAWLIGVLFLANIFQLELTALLVGLFLMSLVLLSGSLIEFLIDIGGSLHALSIEVERLEEKSGGGAPKISQPQYIPNNSHEHITNR